MHAVIRKKKETKEILVRGAKGKGKKYQNQKAYTQDDTLMYKCSIYSTKLRISKILTETAASKKENK
jgi:hypothetical protein